MLFETSRNCSEVQTAALTWALPADTGQVPFPNDLDDQ